MSSNTFYFVVEGDIHAKIVNNVPQIVPYKANPDSRLLHIDHKIDFVLCVGDLTNHGSDGTTGNIFEKCVNSNPSDNELKAFRDLYEKPVEKHFKLYLCIGNHDMPAGHKGVGEYVQKKHNTTWPWFKSKWYGGCYKFKHKGVTFLCLGVYPNDLKWLASNLPSKGEPVIIWYHYNTVIGEPWSDFWSVEDKFKFRDAVDGHNILAICNGHSHDTSIGLFADIPTIRGSGNRPAVVQITDNKLDNVYFGSSDDKLYSFNKWRQTNTNDVKEYDQQNRNTPCLQKTRKINKLI